MGRTSTGRTYRAPTCRFVQERPFHAIAGTASWTGWRSDPSSSTSGSLLRRRFCEFRLVAFLDPCILDQSSAQGTHSRFFCAHTHVPHTRFFRAKIVGTPVAPPRLRDRLLQSDEVGHLGGCGGCPSLPIKVFFCRRRCCGTSILQFVGTSSLVSAT